MLNFYAKIIKKVIYNDDTIYLKKYISNNYLCLIYNKVDIITFLKKGYACNFLKVASV